MSNKTEWTEQDIAEAEQTCFERGYAQAFEQLDYQLRIWQRPSALNFTREVRRLMQICWTGKEQASTEQNNYDQGVRAERMRIKRILHRHMMDNGKLLWHADKDMTKAELEQLIDDGQG